VSAAAAVVLAGGRGARMGGVDKPRLRLGGATLLERAVSAARAAGHDPVVVVGPEVGGGPAAALVAGLAGLTAREVLVLAGDLVRPDAVLRLLAGAMPGRDGAVLIDSAGREQWLAARLRTEALRAAIARLPGPVEGAPLRSLLGGLDLARVPADEGVIADVDTWEDYERAKERIMAEDRDDVPPELAAWVDTLVYEHGLDAAQVPTGAILGLAAAAAHGVTRPAAPVTAFVAGLVAGRQGGSPEEVAEAIAAVRALIADREEDEG